jgi:sugar phosphate isomerase/epimerase
VSTPVAAESARPLAIASSALPDLPPGQLCALAADNGLLGIEWGVGSGQALPVEASEAALAGVAQAASTHGLACCGLAVHDEQALAYPISVWRGLAELGARIGAPHVRVYATRRETNFDADFARLRDQIAERSEVVAAAGLWLLLEPAPQTLVPDPALARQALSETRSEAVGVVYDPGSLAREGWLDPLLATEVLGPLLRHVHVKNLYPRRGDNGTWSWYRTTLDQGIVDWPQVFQALNRADYAGWLVLDHLSSHADGALATDLRHLRGLTEATIA